MTFFLTYTTIVNHVVACRKPLSHATKIVPCKLALRKCYFFVRNNRFKAVPHDFTCTTIQSAGGRSNFDSFSKISIKFGTWSLAFLGYSLKKKRVVTSALTVVKRCRRRGAIYFCMNPGIAAYANLVFLESNPALESIRFSNPALYLV